MGPISPLSLSTFLNVGADWSEQLQEFAIVSGYATTVEKWSAERNQQADELVVIHFSNDFRGPVF